MNHATAKNTMDLAHLKRAPGAALFIALLAAGCSSSEPTEPVITPGSVVASVATAGASIDADGYTVTVGGTSMSVSVDGSVSFTDLAPGDYSVELSGLAANCSVDGANPIAVAVAEATSTPIAFAVTCVRILGPVTLVAADANGDIYTIDESTGAATFFLDTSMDDGMGGTTDVGVVSSMSYIPTTDQWWLGTGGQAFCEGCVQTLDVSTGFAAILYGDPPANGISGLAVHPTSYRIFSFESDSHSILFEFDAATGVPTEAWNTMSVNAGGKGTTFGVDEVLYVVGDGVLFSVDENAGTSATVARMTLAGFPTVSFPREVALATRTSDGVVFGLLWDGGRRSHVGTYLYTLDLTTGEATLVGQTTDMLEGLAFVPTSFITP